MMKLNQFNSNKKVENQPIIHNQKTYQEQERDVYQDYQRTKILVKQKLSDMISHSGSKNENDLKQLVYFDTIQENIYKNMIAIDPTCFKQLIVQKNPPLCFQCSIFALYTLISDNKAYVPHKWEDFQQIIKNKEIEFLGSIYSFQQSILDNIFTKSTIARAKNELRKYLVESNISVWTSDNDQQKFSLKFGIQIQNLVQMAENILGFVEVYVQMVQVLDSEAIKINHDSKIPDQKQQNLSNYKQVATVSHIAPYSSLQQSPRQSQQTIKKLINQNFNLVFKKKSFKTQKVVIESQTSNSTINQQIQKQDEFFIKKKHVNSVFVQDKKNVSIFLLDTQQIPSLLQDPQTNSTRKRIISLIEPTNYNRTLIDEQIKQIEVKENLTFTETTVTPRKIKTIQINSDSKSSKLTCQKLTPRKKSFFPLQDEKTPSSELNQLSLKNAIQFNEENLRNYQRDQVELNWKITKENKQLEKNLQKLQEYDDLQRLKLWVFKNIYDKRSITQSSKIEQERVNKNNKHEMKNFQRELRFSCAKNSLPTIINCDQDQPYIDLQKNLKRFHQILRNQ